MIIDISFGWQQGDQIDDSDFGDTAPTQDHSDYDITQTVAVLKLVDTAAPAVTENEGIDPYDNDYWTKIPL